MPFLKTIVPEFWHHKERVAGKKGQHYIFRNKWLVLIQVTCILTLVPLAVSTMFFYKGNKTETITDLLKETAVLSRGVAVDVEIFFDQYLSTLRLITTHYSQDSLRNKEFLGTIFSNIQKTNIRFSSFNIIDSNGYIVTGTGDCPALHQQIDLTEINGDRDYFISRMVTKCGKPLLFVCLRLAPINGERLFMAGMIDNGAVEMFLEKLKVKDLLDIYILDKNGAILTPSIYFGKANIKDVLPGLAIRSRSITSTPDYTLAPSEILHNPEKDKKGGAFLFSGISKIENTDMKIGILMSNNSYEIFMTRIRSHILIMVSLSVLFVLMAVLVLVTYVVQVLYRADKVRQVYLTKAARSNKMASIGKLAAGVAHEINNPLAIINEKAGLLQDLFTFLGEYKNDTRVLSAVDSILAAVERAGVITHRLLGFARKTDSSIQIIKVDGTIREVLEFVQKDAEYKSIKINVNTSPDLPEIKTDYGKLQQILINLINNAIAALDEKGVLSITATNNVQNESVEISVKDNGCGIPRKNQKKIFEPFFTTKSKIGGTGLGLALIYGLIRDLHGTLKFESATGVGTTFFISLPYEINEKE